MNLYPNHQFLVKNSMQETYNFCFGENRSIVYNIFDNSNNLSETITLTDKNILDFAVAIDRNDKIHLVFITTDGNLMYYIYYNEKWLKNTLTLLNTKSNVYKNLSLKIFKSTVHIFFMYSNIINSNLWTIQHLFNKDNKLEKNNITSISCSKTINPFYVDFDKYDNIHLIYQNKIKGIQQIFYTSFNSFLNRWMLVPKKLSNSSTDCLYPYLFVDNRNTLHALWYQSDISPKLRYKQLPSTKNHTNTWNEINLPVSSNETIFPLIFQENNILNILYKENDSIKSLQSNNYGLHWTKNQNKIDNDNSILIKYCTNYKPELRRIKINHIYGSIENTIILYNSDIYQTSPIFSTSSEDDIRKITSLSEIKSILNKNDNNPQTSELKNNIENTKIHLDTLLLKSQKINETSNHIKETINQNTRDLESKIVLKKKDIVDFIEQLNDIELLIKEYHEESDLIFEILTTLQEKFSYNTTEFQKIESQLSEIKSIIEVSKKPTMFDKFLDAFK